MKRSLFILALLALLPLAAPAQNADLASMVEQNVYRTGVNTNPYEYLPAAETPVPAGYEPFYVSHYGRHGSRSDWEGESYAKTLEMYTRAHEAGLLTEDGEYAYSTVAEVIRLHNHMNGRLTPRGAREHRQIAGRMFEKYSAVFDRGAVRAVSSTSPRCIVSMAAFTGEILSRRPAQELGWDTGEYYMTYCSSVDPEDVQKEAYKLILEHAASHTPDTVGFLSRVFKYPNQCEELIGRPADLLWGTLEFAVICGSFDLGDRMLHLISTSDLVAYEQNISLNLFLRQCNSKEFGEKRMEVAEVKALVEDFVSKADEAIAGGKVSVDLRFGHDYQLLAGCSRMGIKGIGERLDASQAVNWPGFLYSPFAGNLQMVLYRNAAGDVLAKFYINERETGLITLPGGPYYKWEDVKEAFKTCQ